MVTKLDMPSRSPVRVVPVGPKGGNWCPHARTCCGGPCQPFPTKTRFECAVRSKNASPDVRTNSTFLAIRTPSRPSRACRPVSSLSVGPGTCFLKASHTCFSRRDREPARVIGQWRTDANGVFDFFDAPGLPASAGQHRAHW